MKHATRPSAGSLSSTSVDDSEAVEKQEIVLALSSENRFALGSIWRITAKKADFYIEAGKSPFAHLSVHGPQKGFTTHRFHMKIDRKVASAAKERGVFVAHDIPRKGYPFNGRRLTEQAFLVARIRFSWQLQRLRYRQVATTEPLFEPKEHQQGIQLASDLKPNGVWDIDLVVSYDEPYWPHPWQTERDRSRLGPLRNNAGMWLTGTSYHDRHGSRHQPPSSLIRPPHPGEQPILFLAGGPGLNDPDDLFWLTETITGRDLLESAE